MKQKPQKPEVWGGIECTINRLKSGYKDQLTLNGHYTREGDLEAIAELGINTLRYPVLWEKHQPRKNGRIDFGWSTSKLTLLQQLNITPIVGLLHHGSGPAYTNLLDPEFPELFAAYARKVAIQFPWVEMYTPVNEPLTTARFSGLYGLWFPHEKNDVSFVKMLLNQLKATILAMKVIREVNPNAKLVQTEDLSKTYSTPLLQYQAKMENQRRYLTFDLLCGRFIPGHPLWEYFQNLGITAKELAFFTENPCPPDLIGANYYCTSERFLDEDLSKYPVSRHGGNTLHEYADVEAIRVRFDEPHGFKVLMNEMWERYRIMIAVTEAHMHCSREGQMKWFLEIYDSATELLHQGIRIPAVTAWSILGSFGWNALLTSDHMEYERGIFDVSSGNRRPTAMASVLKQLALTGTYSNHVLHSEGWWKSESRYFGLNNKTENTTSFSHDCRPIVILGKTGTLGSAFARICSERSLHFVLLDRNEADICDLTSITTIISKYNPWAIINAAGFVRVDDAESDSDGCFLSNTTGAENLAIACSEHQIQLMTFSSDLVFDGKTDCAYVESDPVNPLNVYGRSKAEAEKKVLKILPQSLVIRTSAFFGPWDKYNFVHAVLQALENGQPFEASGEIISPTYVPHLVNAALDLLIDEESGIWHLSNNDAISWHDFAKEIALKAGFDDSMVRLSQSNYRAPRPVYSAMTSERGLLMPSLRAAISEYIETAAVAEHIVIP